MEGMLRGGETEGKFHRKKTTWQSILRLKLRTEGEWGVLKRTKGGGTSKNEKSLRKNEM